MPFWYLSPRKSKYMWMLQCDVVIVQDHVIDFSLTRILSNDLIFMYVCT
jgi:translation initiation factor IF-1